MQATIIMHGWLRALVRPPFRTKEVIGYPVLRRASVKDVVESLGAPHTEIGTLTAAGREIGFAHILVPGERLEVFPLVPPVDVTIPTLLRPSYPCIRFLVDHNVAKLASKLRMVGLDAAFAPGWQDHALAAMAHAEQRVLLSRDIQLLKRGLVAHGHFVRESAPDRQLAEVVHFYGLVGQLVPFSRCMRCNGLLSEVDKAAIIARLEPLTKKYYHAFRCCNECSSIYWAGSHRERMEEILRQLPLYRPLPF